jgi:hypothetical protein
MDLSQDRLILELEKAKDVMTGEAANLLRTLLSLGVILCGGNFWMTVNFAC